MKLLGSLTFEGLTDGKSRCFSVFWGDRALDYSNMNSWRMSCSFVCVCFLFVLFFQKYEARLISVEYANEQEEWLSGFPKDAVIPVLQH